MLNYVILILEEIIEDLTLYMCAETEIQDFLAELSCQFSEINMVSIQVKEILKHMKNIYDYKNVQIS